MELEHATCRCNECDEFKNIKNTEINGNGTIRIQLDCGHTRSFQFQEVH